MKLLSTIMLACTLLAFACQTSNTSDTSAEQTISGTELTNGTTINVEGMTCEGCEQTIVTGIQELDGIKAVKASHTDQKVVVSFDSSLVALSDIKDKITATGYKVVE